MVIRNTSNRQFRFDHNVGGVGLGTVYAQSSLVIKSVAGWCLQGFDADWSANYN